MSSLPEPSKNPCFVLNHIQLCSFKQDGASSINHQSGLYSQGQLRVHLWAQIYRTPVCGYNNASGCWGSTAPNDLIQLKKSLQVIQHDVQRNNNCFLPEMLSSVSCRALGLLISKDRDPCNTQYQYVYDSEFTCMSKLLYNSFVVKSIQWYMWRKSTVWNKCTQSTNSRKRFIQS